MAFPASVEQVRLTRPRPGGRFKSRDGIGGDGLPDLHDSEAGLGLGGPVLDSGKDGSARLIKSNGSWKWEGIKHEHRTGPRIRTSERVLQYPANRSLDPDVRDLPTTKVADAAVDYVRSLPDVSGYASISDLIVHELAEARKLPGTDVYQGDTLAVLHNPRAQMAKVLLAFSVGEVGNHLSISPFLPPSRSKRDRLSLAVFRPASTPVERFPTPILQICSSPYMTSHSMDRQCTAMMVRIHMSTFMLNVDPHRVTTVNDSPTAETTRIGELTMAQTEGRRHVDMALDDTSWSKALIVDEGGGVWLWREEKVAGPEQRVIKSMKLTKIRDNVTAERHSFFRVAFGSSPGTALVMSAKDLTVIDYEDPKHAAMTVMELAGHGRRFVALDKSTLGRRASLTCVATNLEVLWVDELKTGPPVLTWKHDLAADHRADLSLGMFQIAGEERALLYSKTSGLSAIFGVDPHPPARSRQAPAIIALSGNTDDTSIAALAPLSLARGRERDADTTHLVTMQTDGSLYISALETQEGQGNADIDMETATEFRAQIPEPIWDDQVQSIAAATKLDRDQPLNDQDKASTKRKVYDMRWAWQELYSEEDGDGDHFSFQSFDQHLRELDAPFDNIATLGDLARDAIAEQATPHRAHGLTALSVDQHTASEAIGGVASFDPTRYDLTVITNFRPHLIASTSRSHPAPQELQEMAETFASDHSGQSAAERRRIDLDIRRLVLDLVLSRTAVHSDASLSHSTQTEGTSSALVDTPEDLFQATQQLSLDESGGRAKKIDFKFLVPRSEYQPNIGIPPDPGGATDLDGILQTPSARRLLSEWTTGSDPIEYKWDDWRGPESRASTPLRRPVRPLPSPRATQRFAQSQGIPGRYAPTISASQVPFGLSSTTSYGPPEVRSQVPNMRSSPPPVLQSSQSLQDFGAATQVERGPFGGRLDVKARKKPAKKRVGGF